MKKFIALFIILITINKCSSKETNVDLLDPFDSLYLSRRPSLGHLYVVDVAGEPFSHKVLATSLQGLVNSKLVRLYLLDGEKGENRPWETDSERESALFWLDLYQDKYGIEKKWEGNILEAVKLFASELNGFILVSESEPWTINAGTTFASMNGSLIAFESERTLLESAGLKMTDNLIGKWKGPAECYLDMTETYYTRMDHPGLAILNPGEYRLRDFLIQQGILTVYARPTTEAWEEVQEIMGLIPQNLPVFGYLSLTGAEEFLAVKAISEAGKFLIPSDTTPNLSFHSAVKPLPEDTGKSPPDHDVSSTDKCDAEKLNVVIAISDGDNLAIPLNRYTRPSYWHSDLRGKLPMGWSYSLALRSLAPAVSDYYLSTATENDEWVAMLGIGYAHSSFYPDTDFFLSQSFKAMNDIGQKIFWVLDIPLYDESASTWEAFDRNALEGYPSGILVGYIGLGRLKSFSTPGGIPVIVASNVYEDTPHTISVKIQDYMDKPIDNEKVIIFFSASVWSNTFEELVSTLGTLSSERVRFLLPHEGFDCLK